jgi:predicted GIY-YIG superfamily endonuclease
MIYLIHFDIKLHHTQHYLGWVENDLEKRFKLHCSGGGAKILRRCNEMGIGYKIVATFEGDRNLERKMKNTNNLKQYCPCCKNKYNETKRINQKKYRQKKLQDVSNL